MKRRKSLRLITGLSTALLMPNSYGFNRQNASGWLDSFSIRWTNSETYTYDIFEAMPLAMFAFQPQAEMMSYAKLFSHIGVGLEIYAEKLDGTAPIEEPKTTDKQKIHKYLAHCFKHFDLAYKKIKELDLYSNKHRFPDQEPWKNFSIIDIVLLAYNHTIHHRAQATTYLRLNGITPPKYMF